MTMNVWRIVYFRDYLNAQTLSTNDYISDWFLFKDLAIR